MAVLERKCNSYPGTWSTHVNIVIIGKFEYKYKREHHCKRCKEVIVLKQNIYTHFISGLRPQRVLGLASNK